jgi:cytochrome c peroxidase
MKSSVTRTAAYWITAALSAGLIAIVATARDSTAIVLQHGDRNDYRRPMDIPYPSDNAPTAERQQLGRKLFFDPRLSGSGSISCATCHNPGFSWSDGLPRAIGHGTKQLDRRTPTIVNLAWAQALFWDGRADTLEEQALGPIQAAGEMNSNLDEMVLRLRGIRGYRVLFERAFPNEAISTATVAKAIATFERGVVSGKAPFDRWVAGENSAIPVAAQRGFALFTGKARCSVCHTGWRLTDDGFYDIGVAANDIGRGKITPRIELSQFAFKTPTLRNVALRAPYLHNGSAATLDEVMDLYNRGGVVRRPSLSPEIKPLRLTAGETSDVIAFLQTLTSEDPEAMVPALPR